MVFIYGILDGALTALHLVGLAVGLVQAFQFLVSNRHYGAVARMEVHAYAVGDYAEVLQIGGFAELIAAFHIHVVHEDVFVRADEFEYTRAFDGVVGLLFVVVALGPFA